MFTSKKALLLITNGNQDSEVVITADILRHADIKVAICSLEGNREPVTCANNIAIVPDISINDVSADDKYDAIIIPGGEKGALTMSTNSIVGNLLEQYYTSGKLVAAICAGPLVLQAHRIGVKLATVTAYPECQKLLKADYTVVDQPVYYFEMKTADGEYQILTSQGPGTAFAFALKIVEILVGSSKVKKVREDKLL